jgi:hypothetical protein
MPATLLDSGCTNSHLHPQCSTRIEGATGNATRLWPRRLSELAMWLSLREHVDLRGTYDRMVTGASDTALRTSASTASVCAPR